MESIAFCRRCRGMRVGWNRRYVLHYVKCREWISKSSKLLILTVFLWLVGFSFGDPGASLVAGPESEPVVQQAGFIPSSLVTPPKAAISLAIRTIDGFLQRYEADQAHRGRVAESIVRSSQKYDVDPRLIASI